MDFLSSGLFSDMKKMCWPTADNALHICCWKAACKNLNGKNEYKEIEIKKTPALRAFFDALVSVFR